MQVYGINFSIRNYNILLLFLMVKNVINTEAIIPLKTKAHSFLLCLLVLFSAVSSFYHLNHDNYITLTSPVVSMAVPDPVSQPVIETGQAIKFQSRYQSASRALKLGNTDGEPTLSIINFFSALNNDARTLRLEPFPGDIPPYLPRIFSSEAIRAPPISSS